ncbi:hypothetical protein PRVXT_000728 [Proteinivorax tanatarense]|uniref:Uncharacterized protein n=1 Tax=Proteinivorax tanatarense TaxID=1260629 RepID=A0AAU7VN74_9FIRM
MSAFLGPIHHWLFNKVLIFEDLETVVVRKLEKEFKEDISKIYEEQKKKYGAPFEKGVNLETAIQHDNIHGWLQQRIEIAETRQAAFIAKVIDKYKEEAKAVLKEIHREHGRKMGEQAKEKESTGTAEEVYQVLNDNILDGMPCDQVNNVVENRQDYLRWDVTNCLHRRYWEAVKADVQFFYVLRGLWIGSFVKGLNKGFDYKMELKDGKIVNEIIAK